MKSLNLIKWQGKQFRLISHVSSKWQEFGTLLDIPLDQLEAWRQECLGNVARCWKKVMWHWLSGTSDYASTWEGLYMLLKDVECKEAANQLKEIVTAKNS